MKGLNRLEGTRKKEESSDESVIFYIDLHLKQKSVTTVVYITVTVVLYVQWDHT